jgi:hypothetical protein
MKYLTLIPLAGLAVAAPNWLDSDPAKSTTTTAATSTTWADWQSTSSTTKPVKSTSTKATASSSSTWDDVEIPVTVTSTATGTYCPSSGKLTKPAPEGGKCTIDVTTITVAKATVTVTASGWEDAGKVTVTETKTVGGKDSVTVTKTADCAGPTGVKPGKQCLSDAKAKSIVDNFKNLLEFTDYDGSRGGPKGRGYNYNISAATLAPDFVDISDSINYMAGNVLGSVTFPNKTAFDIGQGHQPEVKAETLNIFHDCDSITWRWKITPLTQAPLPVVGINYMQINDKGLIQKQYAEFSNAAWIASFPAPASCLPPTGKPATVGPNAL